MLPRSHTRLTTGTRRRKITSPPPRIATIHLQTPASPDNRFPRSPHRERDNAKGRYRSGQPGQTVNLLTYVFIGSNPILPTILSPVETRGFFVPWISSSVVDQIEVRISQLLGPECQFPGRQIVASVFAQLAYFHSCHVEQAPYGGPLSLI